MDYWQDLPLQNHILISSPAYPDYAESKHSAKNLNLLPTNK